MSLELLKIVALVSLSGTILMFIMYHRILERVKHLTHQHSIQNLVISQHELDILALNGLAQDLIKFVEKVNEESTGSMEGDTE